MASTGFGWVAFAGVLALSAPHDAPAAAPADMAGAIVEQANPALPGARAGIAVGDALLRIEPEARAASAVRDPFDVLAAELQWSRVGSVRIRVRHDGAEREVAVPGDDWGLRTQPPLAKEQAALHAAALLKLDARDAAGYFDATAPLAAQLVREKRARAAAWLRWRCAEAAADARDWKRSEQALGEALPAIAGDAAASATVLLLHATQAMNAQEWDRSKREGEQALEAARRVDAEGALALQAEALTPRREAFQSHYQVAVTQFEPLLERIRKRYPDTLLEADLRNRYALALRNLGKLDAAAENFEIAIQLRTKLAPKAFDTGGLYMNYSLLLRSRGEEARALDAVNRAIAIYREVAPDSLRLASALSNLATLQWDRGALVDGERTLQESLEIRNRLAPNSYDVAVSLQNLAQFAFERGDTALAEQLGARGQALFEKAQPDSTALANAYHFHGLVLERRGDLAGAEAEYQRTLALMKKLAPDNLLRQAFPVHELGGVARKRGDLAQARTYFEESLAMREKAAPGGLDEAGSLVSLAELDIEAKQWEAARARLVRATAGYKAVAPQSRQYAHALHQMGLALQGEGKAKEAVAPLCEAAAVLDAQRRQVSVSKETQAEYGARYAEIPRACADALIGAGRVPDAFAAIERSRARALRERLGARDEALAGAALPAELRETRADLSQRRARLEGELASLYKPADADKRAAKMQELNALQSAEDAWFKRLGAAAPRYARVLGADALDANRALQQLPKDGAALVYLVGDERSYLIVLTAKDRRIRAIALKDGRKALDGAVAAVRKRILAKEPRKTLDPELARLYARLVAPAEGSLEGASRLLVVTDAGLQLLPFAALIDAKGRFMAERWSVSMAPSVTLALEPGGAAKTSSERRFVAAAVPEARRAPGTGAELPALPGAEAEAHAAAAAYGAGATVLVGAQAREPDLRAAARDVAVLHLAAHGWFDPDNPIESGLLLADGGGKGADDDGVVHAWEVMAGWQLADTRLVVLSACDTGLGRELADEGLIGLTRAFQYAGARNVVATLWPITDRTTAPLMAALHGAFAGGATPSGSLREAQRALMGASVQDASATRGVGGLARRTDASPAADVDASHPYYWAGFEVFGAFD